jgi:gamma-D-glutamyl-L-lysine dipeptidyl-peptidase
MTEFGFCELAVVPVRREPSDKSEMTTQLLFGDLVETTAREGSWYKVRILYDTYEGWIDAKQVKLISEQEFRRLGQVNVTVNRQLFSDLIFHNNQKMYLPAGCSFYSLKGQDMDIGGDNYRFEGNSYPFNFDSMDGLLETANNYLSCPYLWGGKTYLGLDCSGFTQIVYKQHGIKLLRDAAQQATQGQLITFLNDAKPGDLAFFDNSEGKIGHVGILIDNQNIIHCSGKVRIDTIDYQGIFNRELNKYTHTLRLMRRVTVSSQKFTLGSC